MIVRVMIGAVALAMAVFSVACGSAPASTINDVAEIKGDLPANPLKWPVVTSSVDHQAGTMSTLYGNDAAIRYARSNSQHDYPPGSILALVTWAQRDDPHWFGAKIPGPVKSVEFVRISDGPAYSYEIFEGAPLKRTSSSEGRPDGSRAAYLLSLRAAVMP